MCYIILEKEVTAIMLTSQRIKQRRRELRMSIDDLARAIGKNRTTVYRYESGDIENLPLGIIEPLAKALKTTPEYLMGWDDNVKPEKYHALNNKEIIDLCLNTKPDESLDFFRNLIRNERIEQNLTERDLSSEASILLEDYLSFETNCKNIGSSSIISLLDVLNFDIDKISIDLCTYFSIYDKELYYNFLNVSGFPKDFIRFLSLFRELQPDDESMKPIVDKAEKTAFPDEKSKQEQVEYLTKITKALKAMKKE